MRKVLIALFFVALVLTVGIAALFVAGHHAHEALIKDVQVISARMEKGGFGRVAFVTVTLRNNSPTKTYENFDYLTFYTARSGAETGSHTGKILDVLGPGEEKTFRINDGLINPQTTNASFDLIRADIR